MFSWYWLSVKGHCSTKEVFFNINVLNLKFPFRLDLFVLTLFLHSNNLTLNPMLTRQTRKNVDLGQESGHRSRQVQVVHPSSSYLHLDISGEEGRPSLGGFPSISVIQAPNVPIIISSDPASNIPIILPSIVSLPGRNRKLKNKNKESKKKRSKKNKARKKAENKEKKNLEKRQKRKKEKLGAT